MADQAAPRPHFSVFGVPVRVELFFLFIPLLALQGGSTQTALIWTAVIFVSVLAHELGHALAMKANGWSPFITLHGLGGVTRPLAGGQLTPRQHFGIVLAGPAAGLALGVVAYAAQRLLPMRNPIVAELVHDAVYVNLFWSLVNLLPLVPWDGGLLLDSGLEWLTGRKHPRVVGAVAIAGGGAGLLWAVLNRQIFIGYFALMSVMQGVQRWSGPAQPAAAQPARTPQGLWERVQAGEDVEADLELGVRTAASPAQRAQHLEMLAWSRLLRRDVTGARRALQRMEGFAPSASLLARLAADEGDAAKVIALLSPPHVATANDLPLLVSALLSEERFDRVLELAREHPALGDHAAVRLFESGAFEHCLELTRALREKTRDGRHAYNEACCLTKLGRLDEAVLALQLAQVLGTPALEGLEKDEDLQPLLARPEVQKILAARPAASA